MGLWRPGRLLGHVDPLVLVRSGPLPRVGLGRVAVETDVHAGCARWARMRSRGDSAGGVPQASPKVARLDSDSILR